MKSLYDLPRMGCSSALSEFESSLAVVSVGCDGLSGGSSSGISDSVLSLCDRDMPTDHTKANADKKPNAKISRSRH